MRISEYFGLDRTQGSLDFVDVDTTADVPVFIDPRAIKALHSDWARDCVALMTSFFAEVLDAIQLGDRHRVRDLLNELGEPNETHFGLSTGDRSRGRGLGSEGSEDVANMLSGSDAARAGLLQNIEDTLLMVPGISSDLVSDITTHVIRGALIGYTQTWCEYFGIPTERQWSGPVWHPDELEWQTGDVELPRTPAGRLLLVPRSIVRVKMTFDKDQYFNGYLAPLLIRKEIDSNSDLVRRLRDGTPRVNRDDLREKYPTGKLAIVRYTIDNPEALARYREANSSVTRPVLDHEDLSRRFDLPPPDYEELMGAIGAVSPGKHGAKAYHDSVEALLTALLYPSLVNPKVEREIHEGRKRIDITYDNVAERGFFHWIGLHNPAALIPVECKNYTGDPGNPELDQLSGRFSMQRGNVGILAVRSFVNKNLFLQRCRDTAKDGRGFIIPLDDSDLNELAEFSAAHQEDQKARQAFDLLRERFDYLVG
ncbi:hypothetical protein OHA10_16590 [Kribbella sp. NBC_00662]|uniref:hypothetical protein n=1 Tax=Kribbella sp. NBC_00662 TaxID=2975969 RepID=UPI00324E7C7D